MPVPGRIPFCLGALLLAALASIAAAAQSSKIPLGDVAKQPKPAKRAVRVITDEHVARYIPPAPPEEVNQAPDAAAADDAETTANRIAELKEAENAQQQVIKHLEELLADESLGPAQRRGYTESLNHAKATLASYQRERAALEQGTAPPQADADKPQGVSDAAPKPPAANSEVPR
ncbi:MAG: hypothetical protein ACE14L_03975 [Terriglobales bacterium]